MLRRRWREPFELAAVRDSMRHCEATCAETNRNLADFERGVARELQSSLAEVRRDLDDYKDQVDDLKQSNARQLAELRWDLRQAVTRTESLAEANRNLESSLAEVRRELDDFKQQVARRSTATVEFKWYTTARDKSIIVLSVPTSEKRADFECPLCLGELELKSTLHSKSTLIDQPSHPSQTDLLIEW